MYRVKYSSSICVHIELLVYVSSFNYHCVLMCPHTITCVRILLHDYVCVLIQLGVPPRVSYRAAILAALYMCPHSTTCVSTYNLVCLLVCPHTITCVLVPLDLCPRMYYVYYMSTITCVPVPLDLCPHN